MTLKTLDIQISRNAGTKLLVDMNYYFGVKSTQISFLGEQKKRKNVQVSIKCLVSNTFFVSFRLYL